MTRSGEPGLAGQVRAGVIRRAVICLLLVSAAYARPEHAALLRQVGDAWLDERDRWAFTQVVREFDGDRLKEERVERYDPSQGYAARWKLVSVNGAPPGAKRAAEWAERKNKKKRKPRAELAQNFDFANAKVVEETSEIIRYELPLRSTIEWLFPISKVELLVTINKAGPALEQVQARIAEPFRVALGLARILDIDLDVQMEPPPATDPADAKPSGSAQAVVTKFGNRVEYFWSEFRRVDVGDSFERERDRAEGN